MSTKFDNAVKRLSNKMVMSATPVPGFMIGLSGTDSIIAFIMLCEAAKTHNMVDRVCGIHYVNENRKKPTWFEEHIVPWLKAVYPEAQVLVETPLGGNYDQQRWADLHTRALNEIVVNGFGEKRLRAYEAGENYWVSGCINATEKALGKFSMLSNSVSIQPVQTFYKSEIIELCHEFEVPEIAMEMSRIPDCLCGREEIAANNIELIDEIITNRVNVFDYDANIINEVMKYINETKKANDFKNRTPFNV